MMMHEEKLDLARKGIVINLYFWVQITDKADRKVPISL
jgi:hypothetical protein